MERHILSKFASSGCKARGGEAPISYLTCLPVLQSQYMVHSVVKHLYPSWKVRMCKVGVYRGLASSRRKQWTREEARAKMDREGVWLERIQGRISVGQWRFWREGRKLNGQAVAVYCVGWTTESLHCCHYCCDHFICCCSGGKRNKPSLALTLDLDWIGLEFDKIQIDLTNKDKWINYKQESIWTPLLKMNEVARLKHIRDSDILETETYIVLH